MHIYTIHQNVAVGLIADLIIVVENTPMVAIQGIKKQEIRKTRRTDHEENRTITGPGSKPPV